MSVKLENSSGATERRNALDYSIYQDTADVEFGLAYKSIEDEAEIRKHYHDLFFPEDYITHAFWVKAAFMLLGGLTLCGYTVWSSTDTDRIDSTKMLLFVVVTYILSSLVAFKMYWVKHNKGYSYITMINRPIQLRDTFCRSRTTREAIDDPQAFTNRTFKLLWKTVGREERASSTFGFFASNVPFDSKALVVGQVFKISFFAEAISLILTMAGEKTGAWVALWIVPVLVGTFFEIYHSSMSGRFYGYQAFVRALWKDCSAVGGEKVASRSMEDSLADWLVLLMVDEAASEIVQRRQRVGLRMLMEKVTLDIGMPKHR